MTRRIRVPALLPMLLIGLLAVGCAAEVQAGTLTHPGSHLGATFTRVDPTAGFTCDMTGMSVASTAAIANPGDGDLP